MINLNNPGTKVASPIKLAHVVLRTNNFHNMVDFYKTFLGAHAAFESELLCFLTYDEEHHRIGIVNMPHIDNKTKASGLEHIAFTYDDLNGLAAAYLQRKSHGISPFWCVNHGPTTSLYWKDPDGNTIETQVDNFESNEEIAAFMESEAYQINPFGVDFDMEHLIEQLKKGIDDKELKKRPASGPRGIETVPE